jgi:hypothetical protein
MIQHYDLNSHSLNNSPFVTVPVVSFMLGLLKETFRTLIPICQRK